MFGKDISGKITLKPVFDEVGNSVSVKIKAHFCCRITVSEARESLRDHLVHWLPKFVFSK